MVRPLKSNPKQLITVGIWKPVQFLKGKRASVSWMVQYLDGQLCPVFKCFFQSCKILPFVNSHGIGWTIWIPELHLFVHFFSLFHYIIVLTSESLDTHSASRLTYFAFHEGSYIVLSGLFHICATGILGPYIRI